MAFETFDLGRVLQTAEAIKAQRRQVGDDALRQQYLGVQLQNAQQAGQIAGQQETRAQGDYQAEQETRQAKQHYLQADAITRAADPMAAVRDFAPDLVQHYEAKNGPGSFEHLAPEQIKQMATQARDQAAALAGIQPKVKFIDSGGQQIAIDETTGRPIKGVAPIEKTVSPDAALSAKTAVQGQVPDVQRNYDRAVKQGYTGTFADYEVGVKQAGATNITNKQEGAESATVGKGFGELYIDIQKAGGAAEGKIARYDRLGSLLDGVATGKLTPAATQVAAIAKSVGIDIDPKLGAKQAAEAASNEMALQLRNPAGGAGLPGATSDSDRKFLVSMTAGLGKTPEGNRLIIETAKKLAERDRHVAEMARAYRQKNGQMDEGFYSELSQWSEAHPMFEGVAPPPALGAAGAPDVIEFSALPHK